MKKSNVAEIESRVIRMYESHPYPPIEDKVKKVEDDMKLRMRLLGITPEDYVGKEVLDAGCGTGGYACWYASQGSQVTAVDLSEASLSIGSEYARQQELEDIRFDKQSVLQLDYPDASFDYVYSMGVLHHTPDPYQGFRELCRVLRPGGVIQVSLYNKFGRWRHNAKQRIVRAIAGDDLDQRVVWAKRLFPGTCRSLQRQREDSDDVLYDDFAIPHESQHSLGELLRWFDGHEIEPIGAFGPATLRDNLQALKMLQSEEHQGFKRFFAGFPLAAAAVNTLPRVIDRMVGDATEAEPAFHRPTWVSRGVVQFFWFMLGRRLSTFSLSGRKFGPGPV